MKRKIHVGIIDSGIKMKHNVFNKSTITNYLFKDGEFIPTMEDCDSYGHGTAVAGIIAQNADVDITMFSVPEFEYGVDEGMFIAILKKVSQFKEFDILNLSVGINICENINELYEVCQSIHNNGTIIVSAFDNSYSISYPAAFDNVIGVVSHPKCKKSSDYVFVEDTVINVAGKGGIQRVAWTSPEYIAISGNSFACAHISAQIANLIQECPNINRDFALEKIQAHAIAKSIETLNSIIKPSKTQPSFTIKNAAVFPFNKEMHSIIRYNNLLPFKIKAVYDIKYSPYIGSNTNLILKNDYIPNYTIQNIDAIDWSEIDTLIIGHLDEYSALINDEDLKKNIIQSGLDNGKQIFAFDDLTNIGYSSNENLYFPIVSPDDLPPSRLGMLYRISKPVVGIWGTSSKQGKYTLQLKMREIFLKLGYNVGQIGTEPSALLFGMDCCFPIGYNSSVYIKDHDVVRYLNHIVNDICIQGKDLILVGSQSGTVTYDLGNIAQFPISQYNFLLGTQPDCVILCINPFDEVSYIKRTINFLESSTTTKVVALVVFPMNVNNDWTAVQGIKHNLTEDEYTKCKNTLIQAFEIPIYRLDIECDIQSLVDDIIDFFS